MILFSTLFISLFLTLALIPILREVAVKINAVDMPNERKVHQDPIPKIGGVAMAVGALCPVLLWAESTPLVLSLLAASAIIVAFGLLDDIRGLGYKAKFAAQIVAALVVVAFGGVKIQTLGLILPHGMLLPDFLAIPLTLLVIVGVTNAINLADGLDGLAGGISLLGFLCIGYLAYQAENAPVAMFSVAVSGAIFGFLAFNTHPATVFMGDAGSQLLGFTAITLALGLTQENRAFSALLPIILLGFPILDTLTVMVERILKGMSPFKADKNHFHHKLMRLGLHHEEAVMGIYLIQSVLVVWAISLRYHSEWLLLLLYVLGSGLVVTGFTLADRSGFRLKHAAVAPSPGLLETPLRDHLIKFSFPVVKYGLPGLLILTSLLASDIPGYLSGLSTFLIFLVALTSLLRKDRMKQVLRFSLYLIIPFITYLSQEGMKPWSADIYHALYNASFLVVFFFVILTIKLTRRRKGFQNTPMDFLILFIALVLPNVCWNLALTQQMGLLTVKILIFFFGFEILMGELRDRVSELAIPTTAALALIAARAFF